MFTSLGAPWALFFLQRWEWDWGNPKIASQKPGWLENPLRDNIQLGNSTKWRISQLVMFDYYRIYILLSIYIYNSNTWIGRVDDVVFSGKPTTTGESITGRCSNCSGDSLSKMKSSLGYTWRNAIFDMHACIYTYIQSQTVANHPREAVPQFVCRGGWYKYVD